MASEAGKLTTAMAAAATGATTTVTETTGHPGEMTTITLAIREIKAARVDPRGIQEDEGRGAMHDRAIGSQCVHRWCAPSRN